MAAWRIGGSADRRTLPAALFVLGVACAPSPPGTPPPIRRSADPPAAVDTAQPIVPPSDAAALGWMPRYGDLDWRGMESFMPEQFHALMAIDRDLWIGEIQSHEELFAKLYDRLPKELIFTRELILSSLWRSPEHWEI